MNERLLNRCTACALAYPTGTEGIREGVGGEEEKKKTQRKETGPGTFRKTEIISRTPWLAHARGRRRERE